MTGWYFSAGWLTILAGLVILWLAAALALAGWRRAGGRRGVLMLELLRVAVILLLVVTLWRPERVRPNQIDQPPQVAVIYDGSGSMTTRDVVLPDGQPASRADWVRHQLDTRFWGELTNRYQVVLDEFAAPDPALNGSESGTDLNAALEEALTRYPRLRAVVLLTDGDWTSGPSPLAAATRLRMREVPVYAVGVGSDRYLPDLVLERVSVPAYGLLGEQVYVGFTIRSFLDHDVDTTITLTDPAGLEVSKAIVIPAAGQVEDALLWTPLKEGSTRLSLSLPVTAGELREDNNREQFTIMIRKELLRVLVIETEPRWEYRYLRNALARDPGVEVDCLLLHPRLSAARGPGYLDRFPVTRAALARYDVVFVGDVGIGDGELSLAEADLLKGLVEQQASGLVFLPGPRGRQATLASSALGALVPVELDPNQPKGQGHSLPARLALTSAGRGHLLTTLASNEDLNAQLWRGLPGFYWHAGVRKSQPGATVLAVHEGVRTPWGRIPLLVTRSQGNGKVLFMGIDSAWRWRRGVEDVFHYRFWGQVVRWMSYQRHLARDRGFRVFHTPETPRRGEMITLHVTAFDQAGMPMNHGGITARIGNPRGRVDQLPLQAVEGGWGMFRGEFLPTDDGIYDVHVHNPATDRRIELPLTVAGVEREPVGRPAQTTILQEIARITGGTVGNPSEMATLTRSISGLPENRAAEQRLRLWCHPYWGGFLLGLLALYWTGRKLMGMI